MEAKLIEKIEANGCNLDSDGNYSGGLYYDDFEMSTTNQAQEPEVNSDWIEGLFINSWKPSRAWGLTLGKATYKINPNTGKLIWTGGTTYDFPEKLGALSTIVDKGGLLGLTVGYNNPFARFGPGHYDPDLTIDLTKLSCYSEPEPQAVNGLALTGRLIFFFSGTPTYGAYAAIETTNEYGGAYLTCATALPTNSGGWSGEGLVITATGSNNSGPWDVSLNATFLIGGIGSAPDFYVYPSFSITGVEDLNNDLVGQIFTLDGF